MEISDLEIIRKDLCESIIVWFPPNNLENLEWLYLERGHAVAQLVDALLYKP